MRDVKAPVVHAFNGAQDFIELNLVDILVGCRLECQLVTLDSKDLIRHHLCEVLDSNTGGPNSWQVPAQLPGGPIEIVFGAKEGINLIEGNRLLFRLHFSFLI